MEIEHGIRDLTDASRISGGSDRSKTENMEVQVVIDLLLQVRDPTVNSVDVGLRSKKTKMTRSRDCSPRCSDGNAVSRYDSPDVT
ncbi:hypothetical protein AAC387_Pa09g0194 [Persea americana]